MAKVALLIGVSEYGSGLNPLPGAVKDVEAIREVLLHSDIGGFASGDVKLLKNPQRQEMEEAIESLFSGRQKDDLVLLYFSGHGIKDDTNRLYLTTRTTRKTERGELIRSTAVAASFVHDSMGRSRSKRQVVVLDSCFSGAFAEGLLARDDGSVDIRTELGGEGRAVLTSSTSTQYSFEEKGEDLSIYTRFLLEGIRTGAADLDDDGVISIDELHEYASRKVQEFQPSMKPELYAIREGFKIRLTKVPPGDPLQKYRKEVARFIHRGEISFVGRRTLDVLRSRLTLEPTAAQAIEDEVLEPYRQEFHNKLQQYEQVFTEVLQRDQTITEGDRADLQNLQQILGLRNEDTVPIEATVTAHFKAHQKNLQTYEQTFEQTLRQEFPLSDASWTRLAQLKQQLELADAEVLPIEARITAEVESFHQKLQQYEQLFVAEIQQSYPLSDETRNELQQQQESFGLSKVDVAPIEAKITAEIKTYQQKLQQYEQTYVDATKRRKHHLSESDRQQLEQTWQTMGLREEDVRAIASQINAQIESYQRNLRQYEQEFAEATEQQYPLSEAKRRELKQRQQALNLGEQDVGAIELRITSDIEELQQKIQQYEQVFAESIQYEYPLTDETRVELKRFQQILELSDETVAQIEGQILTSGEAEQNLDQQDIDIIQDSDISKHEPQEPEQLNQNGKSKAQVSNSLENTSQTTFPLHQPSSYLSSNTSTKDYSSFRRLVNSAKPKILVGVLAAFSLIGLSFVIRPQQTTQLLPRTTSLSRLDTIISRGRLICGVEGTIPSFSFVSSSGEYTGLDVDMCKALAAAIFGDPKKIEFRNLDSVSRFPALTTGEVDMLSRNSTWTTSRDAAGGNGLEFPPTTFFDGQSIMVRKASGIKSLKDLDGKSVCVETGTTTELNLASRATEAGIKVNEMKFQDLNAGFSAYQEGRCEAITSDRSQLAAKRTALPNPDDNILLKDMLSREPLGPITVNGDSRWFDVVRWVTYGLFQAEELGITQANVESKVHDKNPDVRILLGSERELGKQLGLPNDFMVKVIKSVGNYGEIYERNLGTGSPLKIDRGLNNLWTKGGLMYSPPWR